MGPESLYKQSTLKVICAVFYIIIAWWVLLGYIAYFLAGSHTALHTTDCCSVPLRLFQSKQRTALRTSLRFLSPGFGKT